jgi:hypothetical protein
LGIWDIAPTARDEEFFSVGGRRGFFPQQQRVFALP